MEELWTRHAARVRAIGLRLSDRDANFADDVVQETFAKLWRNAAHFDDRRGTEAAFVVTVARHTAVDLWRRGRRVAGDRPLDELSPSTEMAASPPDPPSAHIDAVVTGWAVTDALAALPPAQRQVIDLAYYEQLSQREIAERLAIPLGTVKTRTFHALKALRSEMVARGVIE